MSELDEFVAWLGSKAALGKVDIGGIPSGSPRRHVQGVETDGESEPMGRDAYREIREPERPPSVF